MPRKQSLSQSMNRIGGLIHSTLDFDEIMHRVISEAAQAVGSETAAISLRQGDHWVVRYVHGFPKDVIGTRMDDRQEPHAVLAIETKKPVVVDDAFTDERVNRAHMKKWGVRSVLVVPLVTEDEVIGVLFFNRHKAATPFTQSHVDFANQLASSVSLAVRNARLFEKLQAELAERKRAEQALQESSERLQAQNEELQAGGEELQVQAEELRAQTEEVTTANEKLREQEQALRDSERLYRAIGESIDYGVWTCAPDGRNTYASESFLKMVGLTQEQCSDFGWGNVLHPEDAERTIAAWKECARTSGTWDIEHRFRGVDGQWHRVLARGVPVRNEHGEIVCWAGINLDIGRLKGAEESLRKSEERLRLALEGGRMGLWEWDLETDTGFWDPRVYDLLGLETFRAATIETLLDRIHPQDRAGLKKLIQEAMADQTEVRAEFRVLPHLEEPRGEILWLALRSKIVRDEQGQPVRLIGTIHDVTPRKQMEAELRRLNEKLEEEVQAQTDELRASVDRLQDEVVRRVLAEGKLRKSSRLLEAFFQHTIAPLAFLDRQFNFVRVNEAYARAQGKTPEFFARKNYFSLYPSEEDRTIFEHVIRTKEPYQAFAKLFPFSNSPQRALAYWNWRITPLPDDVGEVQFVVFNLEDVTERQKAFGELEHRAHQLQKLTLELAQAEDRERRRLAEILHDDLQQVLAAAKFHLGLLHNRIKSDAEAKELADHLGKMLREAIEKSRSLSHELSPAVLYQSDLAETFEWLARQV
jgi:PAS domain S-box-containing protein